KNALAAGSLDMGHARAMLPLAREQQTALARKTVRLGWSVRKVEKTVKSLLEAPPGAPRANRTIDLQTRWLERQLARELGLKVGIRPGPSGDYVLSVGLKDLPDLETSLDRKSDG